jgi:hypothetical protein
MVRAGKVVVLLVAVSLMPAVAFGQAALTGVVRDSSGAVLPGVIVEAESPALIERVRSAATDDTGRYRIENLRPGTYSISFVLPGFATVRQEGVVLAGAFTATINADLNVSAVEETVSVTAETPVVDTQRALRQRVIDTETMNLLPLASRNDKDLALLIPGVGLSSGGLAQPTDDLTVTNLSVHGSRNVDARITTLGLTMGSGPQGGGNTMTTINMGALQEVAIDVGAASAEQTTGGVRINFVPKDGGNTFAGSFYTSWATPAMQGNNLTPELQAAVGIPDELKLLRDINPSFGGPIMRDKLWFHYSYRHTTNDVYRTGVFNNLNATNPNSWTYLPDRSNKPAIFQGIRQWDSHIRLTWQAHQRLRTGLSFQQDDNCACSSFVNSTVSPEAARDRTTPAQYNIIGDWSAPLTNRLLVDGGFLRRHQYHTDWHNGRVGDYRMIAAREQSLGNLLYRAPEPLTLWHLIQYMTNFRGSVSYVTGRHSLKVGGSTRMADITQQRGDYAPDAPHVAYRLNNGIPNLITLYSTPFTTHDNIDADHGLFAQDQSTFGRLTVTVGLRYDYFKRSYPEQKLGPTPLLPNRNITFPATDGTSWHDIAPRTSFAFDVFGDGKTAIKGSFSKFVEGLGTGGLLGDGLNPINRQVTSTTRSWMDTNRDFVPDCNLTNPALNGECGAMANSTFGQLSTAAQTVFDPEILTGWGNRPYNWELSLGLQRELLPRVSLSATAYRRTFGNHYVTDNRAVAPADFTVYSLTVPSTDPRLPNAGKVVSGYFDLNPNKVGQVDEWVTKASNYGGQDEVWNGYDLDVVARLQNGFIAQGGLSSGRTSTNSCAIRERLPETAPTNPFCDTSEPWLTQVKGFAGYLIPRIDVQVSAALQSTPGPRADASFVASNALIQPSLGRPLSGGAANATVSLHPSGSLRADRTTRVDLRVGKIVRLPGVTKATFNVDIYNALNSNATMTVLERFGGVTPWQTPSLIMQARMVKLTATVEF